MSWTLPANMAVAVNRDVDYSLVAYGDKKFYIASDAVERVMTEVDFIHPEREVKGEC